jgi:hypothetical protein
MNARARIVLLVALALLAGAALVAMTWAAPGIAPLAPGGAPTVVSYQGEVRVGGTPHTGDGFFKFAVVNATGNTSYWSNDGTSTGGGEPTAAVQLAVNEGLFSVLLGDTTLSGMTQAMTADVFSQPDRTLRVWFSASVGGLFDQLTPDTRIAAAPYALQAQEAVEADTVDGLHASQLATHYQNVVVVAKSGGDTTTVQAAINSISDAAADNPYLVWVAPGVYEEQVTLKEFVHLQGAGPRVTVISSTVSAFSWPPPGTLTLASDTSVRDLTLTNNGTGYHNTALLAGWGTERALVANVIARAQGEGDFHYGLVLRGSVTLEEVSVAAQNGSSINVGLINEAGAATTVLGGWFSGRGGDGAYGIYNADGGTALEAEGVTALAQNGGSLNYGLLNDNEATVTLHGGWFAGLGGDSARGIYNEGSGTTLTAENVTAVGEDGATTNYGLYSWDGAAATLQGGWFTASGGGLAGGIYNAVGGATLEAEGVTALGENSTAGNYGLLNYLGATAVLRGGSFTGRGGTDAYGIHNDWSGATLTAESVTALGEEGTVENYGLYNHVGATATLSGGSFTARGGTDAYGICNDASGATLTAVSVTALGENGAEYNRGLYNHDGAAARLSGGSFTGRGPAWPFGIYNYGSGTTLEAGGVTALGENGSSNNGLGNFWGASATVRGGSFTGRGTVASGIYNWGSGATLEAESVTALGDNVTSSFGLSNGCPSCSDVTANVTQSVLKGTSGSINATSGTVTVSNGRLVGISYGATCVLVTRGTTISTDGHTCP